MPLEIDSLSGVITVAGDSSEGGWRESYSLEVRASGGGREVAAPVVVHVTKQQEKQPEQEKEAGGLLEVRVPENSPAGTVVANVSGVQQHGRKGVGVEYMIANKEAREKFLLTEGGLLLTSGPLDRSAPAHESDHTVITERRGRPTWSPLC